MENELIEYLEENLKAMDAELDQYMSESKSLIIESAHIRIKVMIAVIKGSAKKN